MLNTLYEGLYVKIGTADIQSNDGDYLATAVEQVKTLIKKLELFETPPAKEILVLKKLNSYKHENLRCIKLEKCRSTFGCFNSSGIRA